MRGGSWYNNPGNCRSANRNRNTPTNQNNNIGFRVVCASPCTLQCQSRWMGIHRACRRRVQICSCDAVNGIQKSNSAGWFGRFAEDPSGFNHPHYWSAFTLVGNPW
ncbi:hypothetical protein [Leptothermofonsia sichuanensis]|uniref:hypothetical protein n=1 Tax=Leptothermofonsia sichuanensis TaxID=2917832 RepID=UPI0028F3FF0D|nr:hypothetical protein [Leptothermofonsia sichuanensis]